MGYYSNSLVSKTSFDLKLTEIENKTPNVTGLITTAASNTIAAEIENCKSNITNLATKAVPTEKTTEIEKQYHNYYYSHVW